MTHSLYSLTIRTLVVGGDFSLAQVLFCGKIKAQSLMQNKIPNNMQIRDEKYSNIVAWVTYHLTQVTDASDFKRACRLAWIQLQVYRCTCSLWQGHTLSKWGDDVKRMRALHSLIFTTDLSPKIEKVGHGITLVDSSWIG